MPRLKGMPFPSHPIPARRARRLLVLLTAACGLVVSCATPAEPRAPRTPVRAATTVSTISAATVGTSTWPPTTGPTPTYDYRTYPRYHGTGWKALTSHGIYSINPNPYTIVFADSTARSRLTPYLTGPAAQITATTGVQVTVSTTLDATPVGTCPAWRRIVVHYSYRPTGTPGMSTADPCVSTADQSAWGGHLRINSEYWAAGWYSTDPAQQEIMRKNVITHELGHIFGLAHPNTDRDGDGKVEAYECVKNSAGWTPTLCSPNGGYRTTSSAGRFVTEFDVAGLKQLARNWHLRR